MTVPNGLASALADRYRLDRELGRGGMATVYLAHDPKHDRKVAVKVLRPELAAAIGAERFLAEIKTTATLQHPHILPLFDSGEARGGGAEGQSFLYYVMPYVEGETLRDRLNREKQLPTADAVRITTEIASALDYAHRHNVIHRDIKPENILLHDGSALVADFGIARALSGSGGDRLTETGLAMGTPGYMSPEQAAGEREIDARSDQYSLACMLYEMLAGQAPFTGPTTASLIHQHLAVAAPPVTNLRPGVPEPVAAALARALGKNPADRFPTVQQFSQALAASSVERAPPRIRRGTLIVAGLLVLALVGAVWFRARWDRMAGDSVPVMTLRQLTFSAEVEEYPALAPAGDRLAFSRDVSGIRQLFLINLADGSETRLTRNEFDNIQSSWTPDGKALLFVRAGSPRLRLEPGDVFGVFIGGDIWRLDLATGTEERLVEEAFNPESAPDGKHIAFDATRSGTHRIWIADERGRNAQQLSLDSSEAVTHVAPRWSPDGTRIVFQKIERTRFDIRVLDVATRAARPVTDDAFRDLQPTWAPAGRAIYLSSDRGGGINVWRVPLGRDGAPSGPPKQLTTGAGQDLQLSAAAGGNRLAFTVLSLNADLWRLPVDPATGRSSGAPEPVVVTTREDSRGSWSPDGKSVAFNSDRSGEMNIWLHSLADGTERQITHGKGGDYQPHWSPDGTRLAFFSSRAGNADVWLVNLATGVLTELTTSPSLDINPSFSPDGRQIAFQSDRQGRMEVWLMNSDGSGQRRLTDIGVQGHFLPWSADGKYILFRSAGVTSSTPMRVAIASGAVEPVSVKGGSHMSFSPSGALVADVVDHREMWTSPLSGAAPTSIFAFKDQDVRIDYPVWSPDGRWILFDRVKPEGGDIWLLEESR